MRRTVWIAHDPNGPDSATARPENVTDRWWEDALRGGGTVTRIDYETMPLEGIAEAKRIAYYVRGDDGKPVVDFASGYGDEPVEIPEVGELPVTSSGGDC